MLYLHDVWVNWFIEEEHGYNVCESYEWRKDEKIELLDQVPLIKIDGKLLNHILNGLNPIPEELLDDVKSKAYKRLNHNRIQMEHCFVVTDGVEALVVDASDSNVPSKKSRVIPRTFSLICEMVHDGSTQDYPFQEMPRKGNYSSLEPKYMVGLTRRERNLKQLLGRVVERMEYDSLEKIHYYFSEWDSSLYEKHKNEKRDILWKKFAESIMDGWTDKHETLLKCLVRHEPLLNEIYIEEMVKNKR